MMDTTGIDWQRQSFAKGGAPEAAPSQMNPKTWTGPATSLNSKIAKPTYDCGGMVKSGYADGGMVRGYADGGEVEADMKAKGLESSSGEKVGLLARLRMGNIDQEGSEAYNRFGAGRAKEDAAEVTRQANRAASRAEMPAAEPVKVEAPKADEPAAETKEPTYGRDSVREAQPAKASAPKARTVMAKPKQSMASDDGTTAGINRTIAESSVVRVKPSASRDTAFNENAINFGPMPAAKTAARTVKTKSEILGSSKAR